MQMRGETLNVCPEYDFHMISIAEEALGDHYPKQLRFDNPTVSQIVMPAPGILEIESKKGTDDTLVISGGMHGNEKSGISILDSLVRDIITGKQEVHTNVQLIYGNLRSMAVNGGLGDRVWSKEAHLGECSNLNRNFGKDLINRPESYAEHRANLIIQATRNLIVGATLGDDIHQSFKVPTLDEVRGTGGNSEYTYAVVYSDGVEHYSGMTPTQWIKNHYSDIVAATIEGESNGTPKTFAGYLAHNFGPAATFEQGSIFSVGEETFTPQLLANLRLKIAGQSNLKNTQEFDQYKFQRIITRHSQDFRFLWPDGTLRDHKDAPRDFMPFEQEVLAVDRNNQYAISPKIERMVFANSQVPIGDRAGAIIRVKSLAAQATQ